ncbi:complement factor H-related protein 4-like [Echeneis naucrates]|uniref:complement factor H-related protein 4-like n=1 Tax=Echeneis naucrates TaxID=173247 RepID=UPI0011143900|nr:complement factor H-related protein 4-like [Echeneis naucrates]
MFDEAAEGLESRTSGSVLSQSLFSRRLLWLKVGNSNANMKRQRFVARYFCDTVVEEGAQRGDQSCAAADLDGGFFVPQQARYPSGTVLPYACDEGHKPAEDTWWATITCTNGKWSSTPMCIDQKACFPPTIPNGKYTESSDGWYEERHILSIRCDPGYEQLNQIATASCLNGTWSSLPICEKSITSCSGPPQIPHAVVNQKYQEVFAADSEVVYQCKTGYATEEGHTSTSIYCVAGSWSWSETSSCSNGNANAAA